MTQNTLVDGLITVAIPTLNEADSIGSAIQNVLANDYPRDKLEFVVVDAGSKDNTVNICKSFIGCGATIRVLVQPGCTVYEALNIALQNASGEFFMRVDARSHIPSSYIRRCIGNLEIPRVVGTGGVQKQSGRGAVGIAVARATSHWLGVGNAAFRLGGMSGIVDTIYLGFYRTKSLLEVGGYDQLGRFLSEDASINAKLRKRGGNIYLDGTLEVDYPAKETMGALVRQYLIYGAGKANYFLQNRSFTAFRQSIPLAFFGVGLLLIALSFFNITAAVILGVIISIYFIFLLLLSMAICKSTICRVRNLVLVFFAIHFSWPLGFYLRLCMGERLLSYLLKK